MTKHIKAEHKVPLDLSFFSDDYTSIRRAKIILLMAMLNKHPVFSPLTQPEKNEFVRKIEESCLRHVCDLATESDITEDWDNEAFTSIYHAVCFKITTNLDPDLVNNVSFCSRILSGEISLDTLPKMTSQQIFPEQYSVITEKMEISKQVETAVKTSSLYRCGRCKQNKCSIESVITRSIDEGCTIKVTCVNCGMWWFAS